MAITLLAVLEDTIIQATHGDEGWVLEVSDTLTGVSKTVVASDQTFGAAMALAIGGDKILPIANNGTLYDVAETLMSDLEIAGKVDVAHPVTSQEAKVLRFIP